MNKEDLLRQLWQLQEWFEEQEILEYELQKKERLLKLTIEEAQADYLQEQEESYYSNEVYKRQVEKEQVHQKLKKCEERLLIASEITFTLLAIALLFFSMPLWQAAAWWAGLLIGSHILIRVTIHLCQPSWEPLKDLEEVLAEAKNSEDYLSLENSLLADYLKLEISFLRSKVEAGRKRLMEKSMIDAGHRMELVRMIELVEQGETQTIEQVMSMLK